MLGWERAYWVACGSWHQRCLHKSNLSLFVNFKGIFFISECNYSATELNPLHHTGHDLHQAYTCHYLQMQEYPATTLLCRHNVRKISNVYRLIRVHVNESNRLQMKRARR